jgi:DDE superfamily endonuclease
MLPSATVPCSLADLLAVFRPCCSAPTFRTFSGLVVGLICQTRRRTVCGMLTGAGLERLWHHGRAHRLFALARWSSDAVGLALTDLIVARLLPAESPLTVAVDDTLFKRSGKKVFGAAWHHDGAAKGPKPIGFGNCWVVAGIVVQLSFLSRPVCLPVLARLWRPRHTGKIAHARRLAELIAARYPDRTVQMVGDAAYVGERLRNLDSRISWTSRLKITSVLHELPPPRTGRSGRPRTRGARLGTPTDLAARALVGEQWRDTLRGSRSRPELVTCSDPRCVAAGHDHGRVVAPCLPDLQPTPQLADTAWPRIIVQGRRAACPAPRSRRTPQNQPEAPPGLGRPNRVRHADPTPTHEPAWSSPGHPDHVSAENRVKPPDQRLRGRPRCRDPQPCRHDRSLWHFDSPT